MNLRRSIAVAAVLTAAPALSSCGFDAPTDQIYNPTVGVFDTSSSVDVLNAVVVSATDGTGTLVTTLVNNDLETEDRLLSVAGADADQAVQVAISGDSTVPAGGLLVLSQDSPVVVSGTEVVAGRFVTLTYTFDHGAAVQLNVPVEDHSPEGPYAEVPLP